MKERVTWESKGNELKANPFRESRAIPTKRLIQRLNLTKYDGHPEYAGEFTPTVVNIRLGQHIGAPANCVVSVGNKVSCGDLIGEIPEGAMGARVHASIDGTVESIDNGVVVIRK